MEMGLKMNNYRLGARVAYFVFLLVQVGCASVTVQDRPDSRIGLPSVAGAAPAQKPVVAVLPLALGLTPALVDQYPHLVEKSVGYGVYQLVLSAVSDSNRFSILEIRPDSVDAVLRERWLRQSGLMAATEAVEFGRQRGAEKVIYGRVFDYAETVSEKITGLKVERTVSKMIGVQLICTDISTLRQTGLGSGIGYGDTIIAATRSAVREAMVKLGAVSVSPEGRP